MKSNYALHRTLVSAGRESLNDSSSFNIFAMIAGIFLVRSHLGAARLIAWFSAYEVHLVQIAWVNE